MKSVLRRRLAIGLVAAISLAACSSTDGTTVGTTGETPHSVSTGSAITTEPTTDPEATGEPGFVGIELATDTVEQLDRVDLVGLTPDTANGVVAKFELDDGSWWATRVLVDGAGPYLLAPLDPHDPVAGGDVDLFLTDGDRVGEAMPLTVTPMAPAPDAFGDAIDAMHDAVDGDATVLGSSWEELAAMEPVDVPPQLIPLKLVQLTIDDGTTDSAAGAYEALDADSAAFVDSWAAKADLAASVDPAAFAASLPITDPNSDGDTDANAKTDGNVQDRNEPDGDDPDGFANPSRAIRRMDGFRSSAAPAQGAACLPFFEEPNVTAERLSQMMTEAAMGKIATSGTPGNTFAVFEMTLGLGGELPGLVGEAFGAAGKAAGAWKIYQSMLAGVMPSSFTKLDVELDPADLEEDRSEPGHWSKVWVTASSTGYSLDADLVGGTIDAFGTDIKKNYLGDEATDIVKFAAGQTPGQVKDAATSMLPKDGTITFCPQNQRVDIAGEEWSWARPVQGVSTVDQQAQSFINETDVGRETLRFAPLPEKFGGATIAGDIGIETHAIDVQVSPEVIWVQSPGETVTVTADTEWAETPTLAWLTQRGTWDDGIGDDTNGPTTRPLKTPTDPKAYPFRVEVESTSRQGPLRADGQPRRYNFAEVKLSPIIVTPNPGNVAVGDQLAFAATDQDGKQIEVRWTATGGEITSGPSSAATYTAGDKPGTYEVTATLPNNPNVFATVTVEVVDLCLAGTWEVNAQAFADLINGAGGGGGTFSPAGGQWLLTVEKDGSFTSVLDNFAFAIEQQGFSSTMVMNGSQTGRVLATQTEITGVETTSHSIQITIQTPAGTLNMPAANAPVGTEFGGGPYRCEGGQLIINRDGHDNLYDRVS